MVEDRGKAGALQQPLKSNLSGTRDHDSSKFVLHGAYHIPDHSLLHSLLFMTLILPSATTSGYSDLETSEKRSWESRQQW